MRDKRFQPRSQGRETLGTRLKRFRGKRKGELRREEGDKKRFPSLLPRAFHVLARLNSSLPFSFARQATETERARLDSRVTELKSTAFL